MKIRRIVTENDAQGCSFIAGIEELEQGPAWMTDLWRTVPAPSEKTYAGISHDEPEHGLCPPPRGTIFRLFAVPTADALSQLKPEDLARHAEAIGAKRFLRQGGGGGVMHQTPTLDYAILLQGHVRLILDRETVDLVPFDVVVQQGTSHAWVNLGTEEAVFACVLLGLEAGP